MIGSARECARLYFFEYGTNLRKQDQCTCFNFVFEDSEIMVWHYRLGNLSFQYLKYLFPNFFQNKIPFFFNARFVNYLNIIVHFFSLQPYKASKPFTMIHSGVWGPCRVSTNARKKLFCYIY